MTKPYLQFDVAATAGSPAHLAADVLFRSLNSGLFEVRNYGSAIIIAEP